MLSSVPHEVHCRVRGEQVEHMAPLLELAYGMLTGIVCSSFFFRGRGHHVYQLLLTLIVAKLEIPVCL